MRYKSSAGKSSKPGDIVGEFVCVRVTQDQPSTTSPDWTPSIIKDDAWDEMGPPGKDGRNGFDGRNGRDGVDGKPGDAGQSFNLRGEYRRGRNYAALDVVEHDGSSYAAKVDTKSEPPSRDWQLLAARGKDSEVSDAIVYTQRGRPGRDGTGLADVELLFEETANAGQVVRSSGDGKCAITNGLNYFTCTESFGLAVASTPAGSRGLVRTMGLLTLPDWTLIVGSASLVAGRPYALEGYGGLSSRPCNVSVFIPVGVAIKSDTLLISPEQASRYIKSNADLVAPSVSTLPKGTPVYLATFNTVDAASHLVDWWVAGVLMADVEAGQEATYRRSAVIARDDWSPLLESGDTLLVANQEYYLSDTPGKLTADDVNRLFIGKAKNTTTLSVHVGDSTPDVPLVV